MLHELLLTVSTLLAAAAPADDPSSDPYFPLMSLDQDPKPAEPPSDEEPKGPWRRFEIVGGVTYYSVTSSILMQRTGGGAGLSIDAEGVLGISRELLSGSLWASLRLGDRHRLTAGFEDLTRTSTRTLEQSIDVNGSTIGIGTTVHSVYGVQFYYLTYAWSFLQDDRMEVALSFGFDTIRAHLAIEASGSPVAANERFILPIPLPGFRADFVLIPDLWLRQRLELMYVPMKNYAGLLVDFDVALEWSFLKHVSLGLGVDMLRIELAKDSSESTLGNFEGKFRFNSAGVLLYLNFHW